MIELSISTINYDCLMTKGEKGKVSYFIRLLLILYNKGCIESPVS